MFKLFIGIFCCLLILHEGFPQSSTKTISSATRYQPPSADKPSWQWLNLMMSATYFRIVKEGEVDFDSCLLYASRSLGLPRLHVLAEGIDDAELLAQSQWVNQRDPATGIQQLSKTKGKKRLELLLLLGAYYAFEPQSDKYKDSAAYFLNKAIGESNVLKEERLKRQALCLLGKMHFDVNEVQQGDSVFSGLIKECEAAGDKASAARAYFYWGFYPPYNPATTPKRIEHFQKAAGIYRELKNTEAEINALTDIGYLLVTVFRLDKAYEAFLKALQLAEAIKFPYTHYNTDALAMVTVISGKFGEPFKYTLETIRTAETTRDSIGWAYFYSRMGHMYSIEGQREEEALKWLKKSLNRFVIMKDASLALNLYNIVDLLKELGRGREALELVSTVTEKVPAINSPDQYNYNMSFAASYVALKQFDLAEKYLKEAARILDQSNMLRVAHQRSMVNLLYGVMYFDANQFERSSLYLEKFLADPFRMRNMLNDLSSYSMLIAIDSVTGNTTSAVRHYKRYAQLLDSNFRVSKVRQAEELQVMYETEEKENQIALLNQEAKLKQANLKQAQLVKNLTIAGIIGALIIAALLYRQNRVKQKNNTLITHKNEQLQHLLTEKEWLLKEIHHRVKNNLQIVMSLLNSQSAYIDNEPALTAIHDSQHRVHAMSLIHQKLYGSENLSAIDMSVYIREMVTYLADSFGTGQRIRFEYNIEPLELDVSQAVPLGLILNEAITNSIKYAFPDGKNGIINVSLINTSDHQCTLIIADNGIGMPPLSTDKKPGSLGMSLMAGLSEDLDGKFSIENNKGTIIKLSFVLEKDAKRLGPLAPLASSN
jgi:two-component sensor histidine kinase